MKRVIVLLSMPIAIALIFGGMYFISMPTGSLSLLFNAIVLPIINIYAFRKWPRMKWVCAILVTASVVICGGIGYQAWYISVINKYSVAHANGLASETIMVTRASVQIALTIEWVYMMGYWLVQWVKRRGNK